MNGKERILTALERKQPDMVPVWELAFNESSIIALARNFMEEKKLPARKFFFDMDDAELLQLIDAFVVTARELGLDGVDTVNGAPYERIDDSHVRDANGVVLHCSEFGEPYPVEGPIKGAADLVNFKLRRPQDEDFIQLIVARSQFPDKAVSFMMSGPFYISWCLRGSMENLLADYILNPDLARGLARMATDYCLEAVEKVAAKGADFIVLECDLAYITSTLMSRALYEKFIGPYHREIVEHAHKHGLKVVKHSDGALTPFLPCFIEDGFDAIHPIQPQCMDIGEIKREFGGRLCIIGNIDCAGLLVFGTPDEVRETVRRTIAEAAPGGGYIISSSNTIHPGCKPENYIALVKAAREFGRYPELAGI